MLRRGQVTAATGRIELGRLVVDRTMHRVELDGELLDLTPKEFDLLAFLAASPDQVYSREELLEHVWGSTQDWQDPATVTEHVRRLRLKLEADPASPRWLQTVRGVGYRLSRDDGAGRDSSENGRRAGSEPSMMSSGRPDHEIETPAVVRVVGESPSQSFG